MLKLGVFGFVTAGVICVGALPSQAAVEGRYVRLDALTHTMENAEWEVFSGGTNLLRGHPERLSSGTGWGFYGADATMNIRRNLVDGNTNAAQRCTTRSPDPGTSFAGMEADLGGPVRIDKVTFHVSRWDNPMIRKWFDDPDGWRVVSVLDAERRVVFSRLVTLFTPEYNAAKGVMTVEPEPGKGAFLGRQVAPETRGWFSLGEFLMGFLSACPAEVPADPEQPSRLDEFARRNTPEARAAFSERFFSALDLSRPGLETVREQVAAKRHAEALESFKRVFLLKRLAYLDTAIPVGPLYLFPADPKSGAIMTAEDLLNGRRVDRKARTVSVERPGDVLNFSASRIPWNEPHPRSLLLAYAATGGRKYLDRWAELLDERSIFFQRWADGGDRRDYFPLSQLGDFVTTMRDLRETQRLRPSFVDEVPALTLARFLDLYAEEAPPVYWRLARRTVFNHQFNIWGGAYFVSKILDDFHVGQRMEREMADHFQRLWTLAMTRDGSMIEVADSGHVPCPLGTPAYRYMQMKRDQPAWFTPELERYFLYGYRMAARYTIRYVAPCGIDHRSGEDHDSYLERIYQLLMRQPGDKIVKPFLSEYADSPGSETLAGAILGEPDVRAIIDTVYGRGRPHDALDKRQQAKYAVVTNCYPGGYQGLPKTVCDYMPYAGIHYLRRDWSPDASFVEMVCQPPGGSANDRYMDSLGESWYGNDFWDTQFHYWDFGGPLLLSRPLLVDGMSQCQSYVTRGWKPGSKTERLVEAPEKPLPNRFHCSARYDYQECFFAGAYQNWDIEMSKGENPRKQLKVSGVAVTNVYTTRQLVLVREPRLLVIVDRVRFADGASHRMSANYLLLPTAPAAQAEIDRARGEFRLSRPTGAQLTVRQFGCPGLAVESLKPVRGRPCVQAQWTAQGETVLVSLLEPRRDAAAPSALREVRGVRTDEETGFDAMTADGRPVVFRVPLRCGGASTQPAPERLSLAVRSAGQTTWSGLALGGGNVLLGKKRMALKLDDCEFDAAGRLMKSPKLTPIWRPIDPPSFLPEAALFVDTLSVSVVSKTPGVEIRYTLDGSEPTASSSRYAGPFSIDRSCQLQARAFRPGQTEIPFATDGTRVSDVSFAHFTKAPVRPACPASASEPGLAYAYMEDRWMRLFGSADRLPAKRSGVAERLLDVGMRQTDGPFAVRYTGYLDVPATGVYTFHAPRESVHNGCEPGYDVRVFVDGEEWRPGQLWHGLGQWSVPLAKGHHRFQVVFADAREKDIERQRIDYWWGYPSPWVVWRGAAPVLEISGPGLARQPVPPSWLKH